MPSQGMGSWCRNAWTDGKLDFIRVKIAPSAMATKGFGGEKGAVGGSGAGVAEGLEPKGNERERVGGEGEERAA